MGNQFDFSGWATRNDLRCSDGRVIMRDAFKDSDGVTVPLVWNHQHNEPDNVLGHALLENRDVGVYAYCTFNDTPSAKNAKLLVEHGDINALSIYANQLKQQGPNVVHGAIREVSLVLAGANPGAFIDSVIRHGQESDEEAVIYTGETIENSKEEAEAIEHSDEEKETKEMAKEKTVQEVYDSLTDEQRKVVEALVGLAVEEALAEAQKSNNAEEGEEVKHNVFDGENEYKGGDETTAISHSDMMAVINDAKRFGSMKESAIAHGIENVGLLFPEDKNISNVPGFVSRDQDWVATVMNGVHHTPFSRIKSLYADITADAARAKGYVKTKQKADEVITLLKRTTTPQTIYKKQKMERDDVIDITDFDVVAWLKGEMRVMLNEEIARAILIGDGRSTASDDKIFEDHIHSIANDNSVYTVQKSLESNDAAAFIDEVISSRKDYKGSGNPTLFTTEDMLTACLLLKDLNQRYIYKDADELAKTMRVRQIVTVPVMEDATNKDGATILGIVVNLTDYNVGADKGGAVSLFDDFDIDYNAQKYLIETRCSGALVKPYSALCFTTGGSASV